MVLTWILSTNNCLRKMMNNMDMKSFIFYWEPVMDLFSSLNLAILLFFKAIEALSYLVCSQEFRMLIPPCLLEDLFSFLFSLTCLPVRFRADSKFWCYENGSWVGLSGLCGTTRGKNDKSKPSLWDLQPSGNKQSLTFAEFLFFFPSSGLRPFSLKLWPVLICQQKSLIWETTIQMTV